MQNIGGHILALLKKYKNIFLTKTDFALRLVKSLAESLNKDEDFEASFNFIKSLLENEHNAKKKIVYLKMLEGFVNSLK